MSYVLILWAIVAGIVLPIQAGINGRLAYYIQSPIYAAFFSFAIGTLGLWLYILITKESGQLSNLPQVPLWIWIGGLIGAFYVVSVIALAPKLGSALTFSLIVAGQMLIALILDHFALLGMPQQLMSIQRVLAVILITSGVYLIKA